MRIYDEVEKKPLRSILIMLTPAEISEMLDSLEALNLKNDHIHIDDENYKRIITIGIYTPENIQNFNQEVIQLLQNDA